MRNGHIRFAGWTKLPLAAVILVLSGCASRPAATSAVIGPNEVPWEDLGNGTRRKAWFNDHMTVALIEVTGGDKRPAAPPHHHPHEQIGYVMEGRALVTLGEKTEEIAPGGVYIVTANVPHTVKPLTSRLVLIESFTPTREDFRGQGE
ncbi:MAG: cupin domain-containing protein [Phycisphaerae bacterium]|nr:cupin domain-containing protein [Phycisphaerae bacterium]